MRLLHKFNDTKRNRFVIIALFATGLHCLSAEAVPVPLFDSSTKLEPATREETSEALVTRFADRARDRHARESEFHCYDHYLSFYWEERSIQVEIIDRVAKGGKEITITYETLVPLGAPEFRAFYRGVNTVAEYHLNKLATEIAPNRYSVTLTSNATEKRPLQLGDRIEMEISQFIKTVTNGRRNYYGTTVLYVVGQGIVPWEGKGERLDSFPLAEKAWLGGLTTLPYQYSDEPKERFKQMAGNVSPLSAQSFLQGRRLHHTDFGSGKHSESGNPVYEEQAGKLGPQFVSQSCINCHVNNGRSLPPSLNSPMFQSVVKVGSDAKGSPHGKLGSALQPQAVSGAPEAAVAINGYTTIEGKYGDGTSFTLQKPVYQFTGVVPENFSVRLSPQLVGLGLLEAIRETSIGELADPTDLNKDGISGRMSVVQDPETHQPRLGRFGYKAVQATVKHQIAAAFNSDMGVTTPIFKTLDQSETKAGVEPEISAGDLEKLTRYISTLGVSARRAIDDPVNLRGEKLFADANCVACHTPSFTTSPNHPLAELRNQRIQPYTDLLLHDMGEGLADNLGENDTAGDEWRTPPLWSIGLTAGVSGGECYLHDGRARSLEEAILWHGGESEKSKEAFRNMPAGDREALVKFLKSL